MFWLFTKHSPWLSNICYTLTTLDYEQSHLFFCQVIPFDNKGQLKEAFNIRYSIQITGLGLIMKFPSNKIKTFLGGRRLFFAIIFSTSAIYSCFVQLIIYEITSDSCVIICYVSCLFILLVGKVRFCCLDSFGYCLFFCGYLFQA